MGAEDKMRYTPYPMKRIGGFLGIAASVIIVVLVFPRSAHAYVDPGTGSYVLQIVIAGIAAASFSLKLFWGRIKAYFSGPPPKEEDIDSDE